MALALTPVSTGIRSDAPSSVSNTAANILKVYLDQAALAPDDRALLESFLNKKSSRAQIIDRLSMILDFLFISAKNAQELETAVSRACAFRDTAVAAGIKRASLSALMFGSSRKYLYNDNPELSKIIGDLHDHDPLKACIINRMEAGQNTKDGPVLMRISRELFALECAAEYRGISRQEYIADYFSVDSKGAFGREQCEDLSFLYTALETPHKEDDEAAKSIILKYLLARMNKLLSVYYYFNEHGNEARANEALSKAFSSDDYILDKAFAIRALGIYYDGASSGGITIDREFCAKLFCRVFIMLEPKESVLFVDYYLANKLAQKTGDAQKKIQAENKIKEAYQNIPADEPMREFLAFQFRDIAYIIGKLDLE